MLVAVLVLIGNERMLRLLFGRAEDSVMQACITYPRISAYPYPALAVYNAGVAGVAYPSLIARLFSAVVITAPCFQKTNGYLSDCG